MLNKQVLTDYRENKRFRVRDGVFAVLGKGSSAIGQIVDISITGLAFKHRSDVINSSELSELSLLFSDKKVSVLYTSLKFRTQVVEDREMKGQRPFNHRKRLCALKFDNLTWYQAQCLDNLIAAHTVGVD